MQKKIIALAVAGLASTAAFAQTNVTIYGTADAGIVYANNGVGQDSLLVQSGMLSTSKIGFKGTEDLGNGVKAMFQLEQGFAIDSGANGYNGATNGASQQNLVFGRQAWVGLSTKAGDVSLGRQYAPGYTAPVEYDSVAASATLSPYTVLARNAGVTIQASDLSRWDNSIKYVSPNMGGFTGTVIYKAGEAQNNLNINEAYGVGLRYAGGPVSVTYVYQHSNQGTANINQSINMEEHYIGAAFDAKVLRIAGSVQMADQDDATNFFTNRGTARQTQIYQLGMIVPVGKGNIHMEGALANTDRRANIGGGQGTSYAIGYTHSLSKRTTLYAAAIITDLSYRAALGDAQVNGSALPGASVANTHNTASSSQISGAQAAVGQGGDGTAVAFGVSHQF